MGAHRVLVIGGDAAGMGAASQVLRHRQGAEVVVLERGRHTSYSACGIPYWVGGAVEREEQLVVRTPEEHREAGIDVRTGVEAVAIDLAARTVTARSLDTGAHETLGFDDLLIATGSVPRRPDLPGFDAPGVHGVQTLGDGAALRADLEGAAGPVRRVVVVGGGYIGLEVAEACRERGLDVTVVDRSPTPMHAVLDADVGGLVADAVRARDIDLRLDADVEGVDLGADGRPRAVRLADGQALRADVVVLGLGVDPATDLARAAGVPLGESGGIAVDDRQRTQVDGVWAAGDCAQSHHRVLDAGVVIALGTHAAKQGRVAGLGIAGLSARFPGVIGTAITKVCDLEIARTGLSVHEAEQAGLDVVVGEVDSTTIAGYMPGASPMHLKVVAERDGGRLLGAQVVGGPGAGMRIDTLAACVWNAMPVDEVAGLDLAYAPPFAPVWDPVLIAARRAAEARSRP